MDFYSTLDSGLLEVITFSPSAAQEMQHYHRNKHVSPLLNPFRPQLIV